jgi:hypothetical protein
MIVDGIRFCHCVSLLDHNPDIDRVAERIPVGVDRLPGAFIHPFRKRRGEQDAEGCLCSGAGRIEGDLLWCAEGGSADVPQPIRRIPIAGAAVSHEPLLIKHEPECGEHVVRDGEIFQKCQVIRTVRRVDGGKNGWQRRGFDDQDVLGRLDDQGRFDERDLSCRWAEGCRCGSGSAGGEKERKDANPKSLFYKCKARRRTCRKSISETHF